MRRSMWEIALVVKIIRPILKVIRGGNRIRISTNKVCMIMVKLDLCLCNQQEKQKTSKTRTNTTMYPPPISLQNLSKRNQLRKVLESFHKLWVLVSRNLKLNRKMRRIQPYWSWDSLALKTKILRTKIVILNLAAMILIAKCQGKEVFIWEAELPWPTIPKPIWWISHKMSGKRLNSMSLIRQ